MTARIGPALLMGLLIGAAALLGVSGCKKKDNAAAPASTPVGGASSSSSSSQAPANPAGMAVRRVDLRLDSQNRLRQIGLAYQTAAIAGSVTGPAEFSGLKLVHPRDVPYDIVWRVDPGKAASFDNQALLAWEAKPDPTNGRCVLRVDGSVDYLSEADFQKASRAKPNQ
jgi:hypothetical protein